MRATWKPHEKHGELTERGDLPGSVFAYPDKRKEPMTDASHVRNAVARFDQVRGVSDEERDLAFANIKKAAKHYGVDLAEAGWHQLGRRPSTGRTGAVRKSSARKAAATRKRRGTGSTTTPARKRDPVRGAATRKKHAAAKKTGVRKKKTGGRRKAGGAKATPARKTAGSRKRAPRKKTVRSKS